VDSAAGPLSISVARAAGADALVHSLLQEFVLDVAWIIPILVAVTLAIGILAIRSGLEPVRQVSEMAAAIGPTRYRYGCRRMAFPARLRRLSMP